MSEAATVDHLESAVREMVNSYRARKIGFAAAVHEVAFLLGISPRRVRAFCHGEASTSRAYEWLRIGEQYARWCDQEAERLEQQAQERRARRSEILGQIDASFLAFRREGVRADGGTMGQNRTLVPLWREHHEEAKRR